MQINLLDIADDLLTVNRTTIERIFESSKAVDCLALYMFYYKTAKWQGTNRPKAADTYVRKCLGWGQVRLNSTKKALRELGLIETVRGTKGGKIVGWYVEVKYIVSETKMAEIGVNDTQEPEVLKPTKWMAENKCLKNKDKCLKNKDLMDTNVSIGEVSPETYGKAEINQLFETWEQTTGLPITSNRTKNRYACNNLIGKYGVDGVEKLIRVVEKAQTDRYAPRVADFCDLQAKLNQLLVWAKGKAHSSAVISVEDF